MLTVDLEREPPPPTWGVAVDEEAIGRLAQLWQDRRFPPPAFDYDGLPSWDGPRWTDFCVLAVGVIACLWPPEGEEQWSFPGDGRSLTDAPALFAALAEGLSLRTDPVEGLLKLSQEQVVEMFSGRGRLQLIPERAARLRDVAEAARARWQGSFQNLVDEAGADGPEVVTLLVSSIPGYRDEWDTDRGRLPFNKLAHLATVLISSRTARPFARLSEFPVYADYMLPRHLRHLGVLVYEPDLAVAVDNRRLIEAGSRWELGIRWATVYAGRRLVEALAQAGNEVTAPELDYHLWWSAVLGPEAGSMGEHHRTLTLAY